MLVALYVRGAAAWPLGFVLLVPWLHGLDGLRRWRHVLLSAWAMSVAYTAAGFGWFGLAIGAYTGVGAIPGLAVLLLAAPLFQPQILAFAVVRRLAAPRFGPATTALAAACAWMAAESLVPRLLGDTLGHGLHPSRLLRQAADLGGATGLTLMLLLAQQAVAAAWARRSSGLRATARPLALAAAVPVLLAAYGAAALAGLPAAPEPSLRMGLVQSNIVDYERLRRERGASAVVREVLDTHFAMSWDAVERQGADAVLWSETVYPTTFGRPKSEAGGELDREILAVVDAARVPFVFGTYDRDEAGEYNAAAFLAAGQGLVGMYRKTRPFPLTEHVPPWLDGPWLRRLLPWTGTWRPGDGARVFPLRLPDGREVPVQPLICLDDMDAQLAIDGARLGAQALLTLSNDSWFTDRAPGARLHLAAAAFRSIETRLPQFRATTNGTSAAIDATGEVVAASRMGERALVVAALPVPEPPRSLMVRWGDWVGRAASAVLVLIGLAAAWSAWDARRAGSPGPMAPAWPAQVAVLSPPARAAVGGLRALSRGSLLALGAAIVLGDGTLQTQTLAQLRWFATLVLAPEAAAWLLRRAFAAHATLEGDTLVLRRGEHRLALPLGDIAAVEPWRLPLPEPGVWLRMASGRRWGYGLGGADPVALAVAIRAAGGTGSPEVLWPASRVALYEHARLAIARTRLDHPLAKFALLPLLLAIPAFRLHQHIAYGSAFGQVYSAGLKAYLATFALWWAAWAIGVVLCAAALRAAVEAGAVGAVLLRPQQSVQARRWLERVALLMLYVGVPAWLLMRVLASA